MTLEVVPLPASFTDWESIRALIRRAYTPMDGVIDPPSSTHEVTAPSLAEKAAREQLFIAQQAGELIGCVFLDDRGDHLYLGRYAVDPAFHGQGVGRALMQAAFRYAKQLGRKEIECQARVELTTNHARFKRFGFVEVARTCHAGYSRPTSITFRKVL